MKKLEIVQGVIGFSAAVGAGIIVGNVVGATTPVGTRLLGRLFIRVGAIALGGAAGNIASTYTDTVFNEITRQSELVEEAYNGVLTVVEDTTKKDTEENN